MKFRKPLIEIAAFASVALAAFASAAHAQSSVRKEIAPGVVYTQEVTPKLIINVVTADLSDPRLTLKMEIAKSTITAGTGDVNKGRDLVHSVALRDDALVAINGDYFAWNGDPTGFGVKNGEMYIEPSVPPRAAFGYCPSTQTYLFDVLGYRGNLVSPDGEIAIKALNRPGDAKQPDDAIIYTGLFGPISGSSPGSAEVVIACDDLPLSPDKTITGTVSSVVSSVIKPSRFDAGQIVVSAPDSSSAAVLIRRLRPGDKVSYTPVVAPFGEMASSAESKSEWGGVQEAVQGGPMLLKNGQIIVDAAAEGFNDGFNNGAHARTAIGITEDKKLILATADGKPGQSAGVSLTEWAQILKRYGARDAINLDGGGSTTMAVRGVTVNYPGKGLGERPVADMVLLSFSGKEEDKKNEFPNISLASSVQVAQAGSQADLTASIGDKRVSSEDRRIIWSGPATEGIGYVTQDGEFHALRAGRGEVSAVIGDETICIPISVQGEDKTMNELLISARLAGDLPGAKECELSIQLIAGSGLPVQGAKINVLVNGGSAQNAELSTNEDGLAHTRINWTSDSGSVSLSADGAAETTIKRHSP